MTALPRGVQLRPARLEEADALQALWTSVGLTFREHLVEAELASVLGRDPELVVVAEDATGDLVGSVFGAFDGRRGWANRLAVRADLRGTGLGRALMASLEDALRAKGCTKLNLLVRRDTATASEVLAFYAALGYAGDDVAFLGKHL